MATSIRFESTKFLKTLFPAPNTTEQVLYICSLDMIPEETIDTHFKGNSYVSADQLSILKSIFCKNKNTEGEVEINISLNGKSERTKKFYPVKINSNKEVRHLYNFLYYEEGSFMCLTTTQIGSSIKSAAYNKETRTTNQATLKHIADEMDGEDYFNKGIQFLKNTPQKSATISLSKVLINVFPLLKANILNNFCSVLTSEMLIKANGGKTFPDVFELKGETVTFFYNMRNYVNPDQGTLGNSCMRYDNNTEQIRFYANNPTSVSLLANIKNKKLVARAVLWTDLNGYKFCDRIYCATTQDGIRLASYCRSKGYGTVHYHTASEFGLPHNSKMLVKLDTFELSAGIYPYLDSMNYADIVNNILTNNYNILVEHLRVNKLKGYIQNLGHGPDFESDFHTPGTTIFIPDESKLKYIKDVNNRSIESRLDQYTFIDLPKKGISHKSSVVVINDSDKANVDWIKNHYIKRYNSLKPTLVSDTLQNSKVHRIKLFDSKNLIYSNFYRYFIPKKESVFNNYLNSYILEKDQDSEIFRYEVKKHKLHKLYNKKLVKIDPVFLHETKEKFKHLGVKDNLVDLRPSRTYCIDALNITFEGVKIKGLIVPFKYLRIVKR